MHKNVFLAIAIQLILCGFLGAQGLDFPDDSPRPIPLTRPEMKRLIEDVKYRKPRIPLPELTDEQRVELGDSASNYEARLRYHYLGDNTLSSRAPRLGRSSEQEPNMSLDYGFKVELFWIVSRTNNCQYCLGHQESKLLGAGRSEDRIAALDCDWQVFTPAERAAFAFARKFTYEPHLLGQEDIDELTQHYTKLQVLEMVLSMSWNNSINRWKEGVGVPQNSGEGGYSRMARQGTSTIEVDVALPYGSYLTPTSAPYLNTFSLVAPIQFDKKSGSATTETVSVRPELETPQQVRTELKKVALRAPRLPLVSVAETKKLMDFDEQTQISEPPNWMRLLANFPQEGVRRAKALYAVQTDDHLNPILKAQLSWIVARQDRAWYALAHAMRDLKELGQSEEEIFALDGDWSKLSRKQQTLFQVARHLAASPVILTDKEVFEAVVEAGAGETVQTINFVTQLAAFDRITEAAGLPLEEWLDAQP